MKCPKCGSKNSDANRFCRSCGLRLEVVEPEPQTAPEPVQVDEVALGEQLFDVWQLYSDGDIDGALARIEQVSQAFPERSSIHSLFALIYERKAEILIEAGSVEAARGLLLQALDRYEKIVVMNPDSAADRQKLASLRRKLGADRQRSKPRRMPKVPAVLKSLPPGILPAAAVFLLALVAAGFMIAPGPKTEKRHKTRVTQVRMTEAMASEPAPEPQPPPAMRVYTFPAPINAPLRTIKQPPAPKIPTPAPQAGKTPLLPPLKVPVPPNVLITPIKPKPQKPPEPAKSTVDRPKKNIPEDKDASDDAAGNKPDDGATALARAIKLNEQGMTEQAITKAQQAIVLFNAEAAAGKNATAAKRGAENARKMIGIWQASLPQAEE